MNFSTRVIFAGAVKPIDLAMNAQNQGTLTRLTLRTGVPVNVEFKRDVPQHRKVLGAVAHAHPTLIFAKGNIQHPMHAVLDAPVLP